MTGKAGWLVLIYMGYVCQVPRSLCFSITFQTNYLYLEIGHNYVSSGHFVIVLSSHLILITFANVHGAFIQGNFVFLLSYHVVSQVVRYSSSLWRPGFIVRLLLYMHLSPSH
jgi:hypothetical protein